MSDCDSKVDVGSFERSLGKLATAMANYFPAWLVLVSGAGLMHPPLLSWFQQEYVPPCLALTMLAMGTSITLEVSSTAALGTTHPPPSRSCAYFCLDLLTMKFCHAQE